MNKTELEIWAKEVFWSAYTSLTKTPVVTKYGAGGRGEAINKILKLNPSKELRERIISAIAAQMTHRYNLYKKCGSIQEYNKKTKNSGNLMFYSNRNGVTWINRMGYEDEIPPSMELKQRHEANSDEIKCMTSNCNYPSNGPRTKLCAECLSKQADPYRQEKRDYLRAHEITMSKGETLHDYALRCKKLTFELMPSFK